MTEDEFRICFSMNLVKYLDKYGITIDQLSGYTGIHRTTLFKYKAGKRIPTVVNVYKIADAFGMSPWTLCNFKEYNVSDKYDYGDNLYADFTRDNSSEKTSFIDLEDDIYASWKEE